MMGFTARTLYHAPKFKSETNQYPALMAVMVSSPRSVYPSAVKNSDMQGRTVVSLGPSRLAISCLVGLDKKEQSHCHVRYGNLKTPYNLEPSRTSINYFKDKRGAARLQGH